MKQFLMIGNRVDGIYNKEWYRQGFVYKDEEAFLYDQDKVCYIAEDDYPNVEKRYTRKDIVRICKGDVKMAQIVFYLLDWQHPETVYDELCAEEE